MEEEYGRERGRERERDEGREGTGIDRNEKFLLQALLSGQ